jgi:hypothetical protein
MKRPSRPGNGPWHRRQATSPSLAASSASTWTSWYDAAQCGQLKRVTLDVGMIFSATRGYFQVKRGPAVGRGRRYIGGPPFVFSSRDADETACAAISMMPRSKDSQ